MKRAILIVFVIVVAAVLIANRSESVFGADSSGYANLARMLDRGVTTLPLPAPGTPPLGFVALPHERMASFYPIGLPIHLALFARVGGWERAPYFVSPLAGVLLVLLTYWLGFRLHSELAGLIAALLMGFCAVFVFQALQPMSDVLAAMWSAAAIVAAIEGRSRARFAVLSGFCFGVAVLVRPTSILLLVPLALIVNRRVLFVLGGIPTALILAWYNLDAFGSLLASGYGVAGATREFALAYFAPRALHYARWTAQLFGPIVIVATVCSPARHRWMLVSWFAAFFVFYSFYWWYDEWWYTRFLLPAYPALAVAAGAALAWLTQRRRIAGVFVLVVALAWEGHQLARFGVLYTDEDQYASRVPVEWAGRALPARSLVLSMELSGSLLYYTQLRPVRWDAGPIHAEPRYALLMAHEEEPFRVRYPRFRYVRAVAGGALYAR